MSPNVILFSNVIGDARLAKSVKNKVFSFDLVSNDPLVIACDMSKVCVLPHTSLKEAVVTDLLLIVFPSSLITKINNTVNTLNQVFLVLLCFCQLHRYHRLLPLGMSCYQISQFNLCGLHMCDQCSYHS